MPGRQARKSALSDLLKAGRNYRELERDHRKENPGRPFRQTVMGQAARRHLAAAATTWQRQAEARRHRAGETPEEKPLEGPWPGEFAHSPSRSEHRRRRHSRFIKACHEYAWAARLKLDTQAAAERMERSATRLPGNAGGARTRQETT